MAYIKLIFLNHSKHLKLTVVVVVIIIIIIIPPEGVKKFNATNMKIFPSA